ncbi:hypothetical protein D3C73_973850 [compost metagenome]
MALAPNPMYDRRSFFLLILQHRFIGKLLHTHFYIRQVLFKKLRQVNLQIPFVELLIKVDCPDTELNIIKIGCNLNYKIIGPHIAQKHN